MNIYQVVDTKERKVVGKDFKKREEAKVLRNIKNDEAKVIVEGDGRPRFIVSRGTDHPRGESDTFVVHVKRRFS